MRIIPGSLGYYLTRARRIAGNAILRVKLRVRWLNSVLRREALTPPRGFVKFTRTWVSRSSAFQNEAMFREIHPPARLDLTEPATAGKPAQWISQPNRLTDVPATFVAWIPKGRVLLERADIITPDNLLLADVSLLYPHAPFKAARYHAGWNVQLMPPVQKLQARIAVLCGGHGGNYYHWMFQHLPRLELFRLAGIELDSIDGFVVSPLRASFHRETLAQLRIPSEKWIEATPLLHAQASELLVTRHLQDIGHRSPWVVDWLRSIFLPANATGKNPSDRIYISRADASRRRVKNEEECVRILELHGFRSVQLHNLSVAQQASLFASASVIVAPHGAALANLAFCSPGTRVLELVTQPHLVGLYWLLALSAGLQYLYLQCDLHQDDDLVVDCDQLKKTINLLKL